VTINRPRDLRGGHLPVWVETASTYLDPDTGEVLPTWDDALDAIGDEDESLHVARFGDRFDAQGVLVGSKDASRCIGYLTKYLTKNVADCHKPETNDQVRHAERLADTLRYEPCSPTCAGHRATRGGDHSGVLRRRPVLRSQPHVDLDVVLGVLAQALLAAFGNGSDPASPPPPPAPSSGAFSTPPEPSPATATPSP
jgi:hypothetical protein